MSFPVTSESPLRRAVRAVGGQSAYARLVGKHQSTINERLRKDGRIRDDEVIVVANATGIPKQDLRPDLFGDLPLADPSVSGRA